jgi:hypothetical protein
MPRRARVATSHSDKRVLSVYNVLASRGRVVAVLVWDAVILLLTKLAQRESNSH